MLIKRSATIPGGLIVMWSGSIASIPGGWALCDGNNGTPDLRDKFIVGAKQDDGGVAKTNIEGSLKQTGGCTSHAHTINSYGHNHNVTSGSDFVGMDADSALVDGFADVDSESANHIPTYFALAYIMKL